MVVTNFVNLYTLYNSKLSLFYIDLTYEIKIKLFEIKVITNSTNCCQEDVYLIIEK